VMTFRLLNPRTRRDWHWGRTQTRIPMSAAGQGAVIGVLLLISAAIFGLLPLAMIFLAVPLLACAGVYDSYRHHRQMRQQRGKKANPAPGKPDSPRR